MGARQSASSSATGAGRVDQSNDSNGHAHHQQTSGPQTTGTSSAGTSTAGTSRSDSNRHRGAASSSTDWRSAGSQRQRTRSVSLAGVLNGAQPSNGQPIGVPSALGNFGLSASPDSDTSTDDGLSFSRVFSAQSLPVQLVSFNGIKCPVCSKFVLPDDVECHLVMCLTKPRINYNEDILTEDKGECVICLEELLQGDTIARLPCLCIYHKSCIDAWFDINRCCPEHPSD